MSVIITYIQLGKEELNTILEKAAFVGVQSYIQENNKNEMLTTGQCAKEYNCSILTIKRYIRAGKLVAIQVKKDYRISRYEFNKFKKKHKAL